MPQKSIITPILGNEYYHIFNRGNNGCRLFFNDINYALFLKMYREFVSPFCDTLSYCLIANHFHLLVKTNASVFVHSNESPGQSNTPGSYTLQQLHDRKVLINHYRWDEPIKLTNVHNHISIQPVNDEALSEGQYVTDKEAVGRIISEQFRKMFLQYALIIKKQENIKGSLFVKPFRRLMIENQDYLEQVLFYIHTNPAKHDIQQDFKTYKYSSYRHILSDKTTFVAKDHVLELFGSIKNFEIYHDLRWEERQAMMSADTIDEEND